MTLVPSGIDPNVPMMVAISPRENHTPGRFIGMTLVRQPNVHRVVAAATTARTERPLGTAGRSGGATTVTRFTSTQTVTFVNVTIDDDVTAQMSWVPARREVVGTRNRPDENVSPGDFSSALCLLALRLGRGRLCEPRGRVVEDALQAVLEVLLVSRADAVSLVGDLCEQRRNIRIDDHGLFVVARGVVVGPVLLVEAVQHHRAAHVYRDALIGVEGLLD